MHLIIAVINNEELLDELITGWIDLGITDATVVETTDFLQRISHNVPIFAGFRSLTSGGMRHNHTVFTAVQDKDILDAAISYLENICSETSKPDQGIYYVLPLSRTGLLGKEEK